MKNKIFLFLGPPGSGKGTLSEMCIQQFGWQHLSTGNLCRDHIERKTQIGQQIQEIIASGGLVPDEIIADMVVDWIMQQKIKPEGIIFDGYPRTKNQAELLYKLVQEKLQGFELVLIKLNVDAQILIERITNRVICSNKECGRVYSLSVNTITRPKKDMICDVCASSLIHRADDTQESLKKRLQIYYQHEQEIIDCYVDKGLNLSIIQGAQAIQKVFEEFKKIALCDYVC